MHQQLLFLIALPYYLFAISLLSLILASILIYLKFHIFKLQSKVSQALLEITPPYDTKQSSYSTEQLYSTLSKLTRTVSVKDALLGAKQITSFELVSTREKGIRYFIRANNSDAEIIKKNLYSFLPGVHIQEVEEYLPTSFTEFINCSYHLLEFKLRNHFAYPLQIDSLLKEHDPIAYITGHMTKLQNDECISLQVLLTPLTPESHRKVSSLIQTITWHLSNGKNISSFLKRKSFISKESMIITAITLVAFASLYVYLFIDIQKLLPILVLGFFGFVWWYLGYDPRKSNMSTKVLSQQPEVYKDISEKLGNPLFETTVRLYIQDGMPGASSHRISGLIGSLLSSTQTQHQGLKVKKQGYLTRKIPLLQKYSYFLLKNRFLSMHNNPILSSSEIAAFYHFPYTPITKTEGMVKSKSQELPAPLSLKKNSTELDVIVGRNTYGGEETVVGLSKEDRKQHAYIVGKSGMGKSTIIEGMALQDIRNNKGVAVIDPHGDMVDHLLTLIPEQRLKDVIYINPSDKSYPIGLNILSPGVKFTDPDEAVDRISTEVLQVFMKITPEKNWGQRMEHILRNSALTALQIPQGTPETPYVSLYTIQKLLTDTVYRTAVIKTVTDPILKQFWEKEFKLYGTRQQVDVISPITNKIGEFITNKMSRNILLQKNSTVNILEIMDEGKILLVNLSKGKLGDERSNFFGTIMTSLIQLAIYQRVQIPENKRRDFFVYIDEFQNFATSHFTDLFSEARKYHVFFIPSHQNIAQIDDVKVAKIIQGNSGTIIALKGSPDDEKVLLPFLSPEVEKGQIVNLPPHHFFMKVTNPESEDAFTGVTIPIDTKGDESIKEKIIAHSRAHFATPREDVEKDLEKLLAMNNVSAKIVKKETKKDKPTQTNGTKPTETYAKQQVI